MNKRAGKLNQHFVERVIRSASLRQPQFFQHVMRFEIKLPIKAFEISEIVRIQLLPFKLLDQFCNWAALFTHEIRRIENANDSVGKTNQTLPNPGRNPKANSVSLPFTLICVITVISDKL